MTSRINKYRTNSGDKAELIIEMNLNKLCLTHFDEVYILKEKLMLSEEAILVEFPEKLNEPI